jgi:hypothetical protein
LTVIPPADPSKKPGDANAGNPALYKDNCQG